ncbi:MAG: carbon-nitrogen hydrolase family protein [Candidatus Omnitrophica bacterium]|nr:carbon-nitrogen hydrolase family protein [Candidatus Omnitrophota bacterium]
MKTALIQLQVGKNAEANLKKAVYCVEEAAKSKAGFVLLPELFLGGIEKSIDNTLALTYQSALKTLQKMAKKRKIFLLAGSAIERVQGINKFYNTAILFSPQGKITAKYRKINLFKACLGEKSIQENKFYFPGDKAAQAKVDNFLVGLAICYDLRFPVLFRKYCEKGVHIISLPSNFTQNTGEAHWEVLLRARAIENQCYILAPNQVGESGNGIMSYGNSMIVDPWGTILARASGDKEEIIYADILLARIKEAQRLLPGIRKKV